MLLSPPLPQTRPEASRLPRPGFGTEHRIWLIRHGRVLSPTTAYGDDDVELSEAGLDQTRRAGDFVVDRLGATHVVTSPLVRAMAMGQALATGAGCPLEVDPGLKEMNRGVWQGLERVEYAARWRAEREAYWADPLQWRGHGGESEAMLLERTWPVLERLCTRQSAGAGSAPETRILAAHRQVIRALVAAAMGIPPGRSHLMQLDPAHSILLQDTGGGWSLERTNVPLPGMPHAAEPEGGPPEDVPTRTPRKSRS